MQDKFSSKYIFAPVTILLSFNIFTLVLFVLGPIKWDIKNEPFLVLYIITNLLSLYSGYKRGVITYKLELPRTRFNNSKSLLIFLVIAGFIWIIPLFFSRLGVSTLAEVQNKVIEGVTNPSGSYFDKVFAFENNGNSTFFSVINTILSPLTYCFFPLSVQYFNNFNKKIKTVIVIGFILEFLSWFSLGTNKGIVDIFLIIFFINLAINPSLYQISKKKMFTLIIFISLLLFMFYNNILSRIVQGDTSKLTNLNLDFLGNSIKSTGIYEEMNLALKFGLSYITSYLSQGYYCLSLALDSSFTWTYGFGNSLVSMKIWMMITNESLMPVSYLGILQRNYDIDPAVAWHSIYVWIASDTTFWGVPFVMFFIGYFLSVSWLDTIYKRTLVSSIVFCLFAQMIFYFFANNQILSFSFIPFLTFFTLWRVLR